MNGYIGFWWGSCPLSGGHPTEDLCDESDVGECWTHRNAGDIFRLELARADGHERAVREIDRQDAPSLRRFSWGRRLEPWSPGSRL